MTQDEIIEMAKQAGLLNMDYELGQWEIHEFTTFAKLIAEKEREEIAQMIEDAPALMESAQNDQGGCLMCGFTPKLAANSIRARVQA